MNLEKLVWVSGKFINMSKISKSVHIYQNILLKFDKDQTFIFVCRRSCLSDTKNFMINMYNNYHYKNDNSC